MCINPSKQELDNLYNDLNETGDAIKKWLEVEPEEKWTLSYDFSGLDYENMMIKLFEVFNNILKSVCGLPLMAIMQMVFFNCNKYFV